MDLTDLNDKELMEQFQNGIEEAFNILVDRYSERLENYIARFVRDRSRCEDLLQETFLRVYRNRHSYEPRSAKLSTWLFTIAGNLGKSEYRKRKRRGTRSIYAVSRDNEEYEMDLPDESGAPDDYTDSTIQDEYIQRAIDNLSDTYREVIILRELQQLTYEEICDITGLPMGTVKSRINRGRKHLQEMLSEVYG